MSAMLLGGIWCTLAVVLDIILWVEPVGILSGPLVTDFSPHHFYMERYFPYLFITYGAALVTPIVHTWVRNPGSHSRS